MGRQITGIGMLINSISCYSAREGSLNRSFISPVWGRGAGCLLGSLAPLRLRIKGKGYVYNPYNNRPYGAPDTI